MPSVDPLIVAALSICAKNLEPVQQTPRRVALGKLPRDIVAEFMDRAYAHALATGYRFFSYGDASVLFPSPPSEGSFQTA